MRVHYYKQFFPGSAAVGTLQPLSLCKRMADRGHEVTVLATDFNVASEATEVEEEYASPSGGHLAIRRFPSPRGLRKNLSARLRTYLSFMVTAFREGLRLEEPDLVVASIQPLFSGVAAMGVAKLRKAPVVLEVRDLWPDALEVKGAVKGWKLRPLYSMASMLYDRADRIVSLTPGIKTELVGKGIPSEKVDVFPNGFDPALWADPTISTTDVREEYGWGDDFVAVYVGTHTEVTAIETLVRAGAELIGESNLRIELIGSGQTKEGAQTLASDLGANNVHFRDPVPKTEVPAVLAAADVTLMSLFTSPLEHIYFENKLLDYMGAGKPILAAMGGDQAKLIEEHGVGRVVPAFDHRGLAELIRDARGRPGNYREMGLRGIGLVDSHFLLDDILQKYVDRIEAVAEGDPDRFPAWEPISI